MTSSVPVSEKRRKRSGGNVMIESVFTMLPTFALVFGMIDLGIMFFRWSTLQNAVREGCRYAITFQTQTGQGQDASIKAIVEQYAMGFVKASDSPAHIFVNYYNPDLSTGTNVPGNIVEVSVQNISFNWLAPLSGTFASPLYTSSPLGIRVYSADILGGYPAGATSVTR